MIFKGSGTNNRSNKFSIKKPSTVPNTLSVGSGHKITSPYTVIIGDGGLVTGGLDNDGSSLSVGHNNISHSSNSYLLVGDNNHLNNVETHRI